MAHLLFQKGVYPAQFLQPTADFIRHCQQADGSIWWDHRGKLDPWDHCEAAMGLAISGDWIAAERAYFWLAEHQLSDGSWWSQYQRGKPVKCGRRETNFIAYIATGVWHQYLITNQPRFARRLFPTVARAIDCVLRCQSREGDIAWAIDDQGQPMDDALLTGCSSIYKSLECAINLGKALGQDTARWQRAYHKLGYVLRHRPERFDRSWESKSRYSMDWFYPILAGVYEGRDARTRLLQRWDHFVRPDMGCVCVDDQPWVTVAESCELTIALLAAGERTKANELLSALHQWRHDDGSYWTGYQYEIREHWPIERTSWTAAAVLLAADALTGHTRAHSLFLRRCLDGFDLDIAIKDRASSHYE